MKEYLTAPKPSLKIILLLFFVVLFQGIAAQKKKVISATAKHIASTAVLASAIPDTTPLRKAIFNRELSINPHMVKGYYTINATDTVWDLTPYLQSKVNCDYEKAIDSNGCVLVKYTDGLTKKICAGKLVEVVTPDGKKHVARLAGTTAYMYVMPVPPPPNPSDTDTAAHWLASYNTNLLDEISGLFADDQTLITHYMNKEEAKCKGSIYKQIEFRTIFIEEFLKAK